MKLFNESKNKYLLAVIALVNRIYNNEGLSSAAFEQAFLAEADDKGLGLGSEMLRKMKAEYQIFDFSDKSKVSLYHHEPIAILPSMIEKMWLKYTLGDERITLFLSESTIVDLQEKLAGIETMNPSQIFDVKGLFDGDVIDAHFIKNFQTILTAIKGRCYLRYSNTARDGTVYKGMNSIPFKVEYSITQQKFRVSMWSLESRRPIKANISSMTDISAGSPIVDKEFTTIKEMLETKLSPEPLVIIIFNKNNAVERASLLFSQYNRKSRWLDDNTLLIEITYYTFDEDELVSNILSFGPMSKVESPPGVVEKIRQRLGL